MGLRRPTDQELEYINQNIAKEECRAEDCYLMDGVTFANDFMKTCYGYYLGNDSLLNFVNDLAGAGMPIQVNHGGWSGSERILPLGRWFDGSLATISKLPEDAKPGRNNAATCKVFMPTDLEFEGYNTDDIAKAYRTGALTDVSIGQDWSQATFECDICHKDITDAEECPHVPGREYDGTVCTFTVHGSHLKEISFVWSGGLPGANLMGRGDGRANIAGKVDWEEIKQTPKGVMPGSLMALAGLSVPFGNYNIEKHEKKEESAMTFEDVEKQFATELSAKYVLVQDHEKLQAEHSALTEKFGAINSELEASKDLVEIGKKQLEDLTKEYHRLGVALSGDKWNEEAENDLLAAIEPAKRANYLVSKIGAMKEQGRKNLEKGPVTDKGQDHGDAPYNPLQNPALYKV